MTNYFNINRNFTCAHCRNQVSAGQMLSGVNNRNHCPYCLWSRHLDLFQAGDRMAACKAPMQPVGLTQKNNQKKYASGTGGEMMLIHWCSGCEKISINRIAADDVPEVILEVFRDSLTLSIEIREIIQSNGIHLLGEASFDLINQQLYGQSIQPVYTDLVVF